MPAACAICLQPIGNKEQFVLAGTEVFHPSCAGQRGIHVSVRNRQREQLAALEEQLRGTKAAALNLEPRIRRLESEIHSARQSHEAMSANLQQALNNEASWRRRYEEVRDERARFEVERDAARRELALMRQLGYQLPEPTGKVTPEDTRDATEIRFSLLDLD
jgi:chromosome segregation ATPase